MRDDKMVTGKGDGQADRNGVTENGKESEREKTLPIKDGFY